ncbi:cytochrome P450 [Punctularia strigosozonata HHB-11173 SS5]|uniref:cytochrome P450 n=1 Tax=Punctularia strigosozonata (strain HHB-11173) TaxID=741275 RepID=UPI0004418352|nr:cytochrome P450 [Punctularia strigosozonata HHB-11173 SS5]EIN12237.1 cytochrome P450 [Punctularia strigosozonata HHB-11173 SS5]
MAQGTGLGRVMPLSEQAQRVWVGRWGRSMCPYSAVRALGTSATLWSTIVRRFFLSPLRKIPGSKLAALTDIWLIWNTIQSRSAAAINEAFNEYGPIVRIGPNAVAVRGPKDLKEIYTTHKYRKDARVTRARLHDLQNITSVTEPAAHGRMRRLTNPLFASDSLRSLEQPLVTTLEKLFGVLDDSISRGRALDMWPVNRHFAFDILGEAAFGRDFGALASGKNPQFMVDMDLAVTAIAMKMSVPPWVYAALRKVPVHSLRNIVQAEERLLEFGQNLIREYEKGGGGSGEEKGRYNMIAHLYDSTDPVTGTSMSEEMLVSMCVTYIIAGTDTTGTTLSWLMWALASHPHVYDTLRAELIAAFPDPGAFPDLASLRKLPYLTAVIKEALRRYPATPIYLPRVVPEGGAVHQGHYLPAGTAQHDEDRENRPPTELPASRTSSSDTAAVAQRPKPRATSTKRKKTQPAAAVQSEASEGQAPEAALRRKRTSTRAAGKQPATRAGTAAVRAE